MDTMFGKEYCECTIHGTDLPLNVIVTPPQDATQSIIKSARWYLSFGLTQLPRWCFLDHVLKMITTVATRPPERGCCEVPGRAGGNFLFSSLLPPQRLVRDLPHQPLLHELLITPPCLCLCALRFLWRRHAFLWGECQASGPGSSPSK